MSLADLARRHWWVKLAVWVLLGAVITLIPAITVAVLLGIIAGTPVFGLFWVLMAIGMVSGAWLGYRQERRSVSGR